MNIPIALVKKIREQLGATRLVLLAADEDGEIVSTHGKSVVDAQEAAKLGNDLKKVIGWPQELCNAKPLERVCGNCSYFQADRGTFYMNSGYDERVYGKCMVEPRPIERAAKDRACQHFEPNT